MDMADWLILFLVIVGNFLVIYGGVEVAWYFMSHPVKQVSRKSEGGDKDIADEIKTLQRELRRF